MMKTTFVSIGKVLLAMYIVTGILLVILAGLLYKYELSESAVGIVIIIIYIAVGFLGGFILGKITKNKKFVWGAAIGALYFAILLIASLILHKGIENDVAHFITTFVLCTASGTAGGMLS